MLRRAPSKSLEQRASQCESDPGAPINFKDLLLSQRRSCCTGHHRKLRVTAQPNVSLTLEHVPQHCRRAKTVLLGPLTPSDLDAAAFVHQQHGQALSTLYLAWL